MLGCGGGMEGKRDKNPHRRQGEARELDPRSSKTPNMHPNPQLEWMCTRFSPTFYRDYPHGSMVNTLHCDSEDTGSIPTCVTIFFVPTFLFFSTFAPPPPPSLHPLSHHPSLPTLPFPVHCSLSNPRVPLSYTAACRTLGTPPPLLLVPCRVPYSDELRFGR